MNQATPSVDKKNSIYLCTSDPTPKPRYLPKPPKELQRSYQKGRIVRTRHHLGQPVQSENTRPLTPPLNYRPRPRTAILDQGAKVKQRYQELNPEYHKNNLLEQQAELARYSVPEPKPAKAEPEFLITAWDLIDLLEQQAELQRYRPRFQASKARILALF